MGSIPTDGALEVSIGRGPSGPGVGLRGWLINWPGIPSFKLTSNYIFWQYRNAANARHNGAVGEDLMTTHSRKKGLWSRRVLQRTTRLDSLEYSVELPALAGSGQRGSPILKEGPADLAKCVHSETQSVRQHGMIIQVRTNFIHNCHHLFTAASEVTGESEAIGSTASTIVCSIS